MERENENSSRESKAEEGFLKNPLIPIIDYVLLDFYSSFATAKIAISFHNLNLSYTFNYIPLGIKGPITLICDFILYLSSLIYHLLVLRCILVQEYG